jgi:mannose-6-phosphate isomerase-like protein (cupin superfamily)
MLNIRRTVLTGLAVVVIGSIWHPKTTAQENSSTGVITVFDHGKLDASFTRAISNGGSDLLWSRTSSKGTFNVSTHSRESMKAACKPEGCSHTGFTAFVYVVSGAATLVIGGTAKAAAPDKFGGQAIQGGESHRISKGDVYIVPPDTIHW